MHTLAGTGTLVEELKIVIVNNPSNTAEKVQLSAHLPRPTARAFLWTWTERGCLRQVLLSGRRSPYDASPGKACLWFGGSRGKASCAEAIRWGGGLFLR